MGLLKHPDLPPCATTFVATRLEQSSQVGTGPLWVKGAACEKWIADPRGRIQPHALHFLGPADPVLPQQMKAISSSESGVRDEAVFH